ncbi:MAG: hypothetical protein ACAH83_09860 [Alphaproteobacteria bacterium]
MTDKSEWKVLSFRDDEEPVPATLDERTAHIRQRAMEKFHLADNELNDAVTPSYSGTTPLRHIETGAIHNLHVFELQISKAAAERLARQHHPEVLLISSIVERPQPAMGAWDPRTLPKGPKIKW